ncbi:MAG: PASTA domain-containing protein [Brevinematales bacterium]
MQDRKYKLRLLFEKLEDKWVRYFSAQNVDIYRRIFRKMVFFSILSGIVALFVILVILSVHRIAAPKTKVPAVKSLELFEAVRILQEKGLAIDIETKFEPNVPRYIIIDQFPKPGITVRQGRTVKILVSMGKDTYTVPYLVGKTREEAENLLRQLNIPYEMTVIQSDEYALNTVISQDKKENLVVDRNEKLMLVVNSDIKSTEARVPSLLGKSIDTAARDAISAGLAVKLHPFLTDDETKEGIVMAQSLEANTIVPKNTDIALEVGIYARVPSATQYRYYLFTHTLRSMNEADTSDVSVLVVMVDENSRPIQLFNSTMSQGQLIVIPFKALGTATVQLFINNSLVREETYVP